MARRDPSKGGRKQNDIPAIEVSLSGEGIEMAEFKFREAFRIGRGEDCQVQILSPGVSRRHVEVEFRDGRWWLKDLDSANGTYVSGKKVREVPLGRTRIELGLEEAIVEFAVEGYSPQAQTRVSPALSVSEYVNHYFSSDSEEGSGAHTRLIREAFKVVNRKQRVRYSVVIAAVAGIAIAIGIYSYLQEQELRRQRALAEEIFYSMKALELEITRLETRLSGQKDQGVSSQLADFRDQQRQLLHNYEGFLDELQFYEDSRWSETDRRILRVARMFGECELAAPREFLDLVYEYIEKWKTSDRLPRSIRRAEESAYDEVVVKVMLEHDLPPHFFFLVLQESDFRAKIVGPATRFGIAKGMWQFIPATATRYGLKTGPLVELRRYDPRDERFDFEKATGAAARYIRDIYNTEAQASGLLVIASYNWGERNIRNLVRQLPLSPSERNFWKVLEKYGDRIPKETYDYVFYIISAAIIAEDPKLFGFDFESPLEIPQ